MKPDQKTKSLPHQQKEADLPVVGQGKAKGGGKGGAQSKKKVFDKDQDGAVAPPQNAKDPKKIVVGTQSTAQRHRP